MQNEKEFLRLAKKLCKARRGELPILANVLINYQEGYVSGTNLEVGLRYSIDPDNKPSICVPAKQLTSLEITAEGEKYYNAGIQLDTLPASEAPLVPSISTDLPCLTLNSSALKKVSLCASNNHMRPVISTVHIIYKTGWTFYVATDSYQLVEYREPNQHEGDTIEFSIRKDVIAYLPDEEVTAIPEIKHRRIFFVWGKIQLSGCLVEGQYPDYTQVIKAGGDMVKIEQPDFIPAVKLFKTAGAEKDLDWAVETQNFVIWNSYNPKVRWSGGNKLYEEIFTTEHESPLYNTRYILMPFDGLRDNLVLKYSTFNIELISNINKLFQGDILVSKCQRTDHPLQVWGNLSV